MWLQFAEAIVGNIQIFKLPLALECILKEKYCSDEQKEYLTRFHLFYFQFIH